MISFQPFFQTIKDKDLTTYRLINYYNLSRSLLDRLKHDKPISTATIDYLCEMLGCNVEDVIAYRPGEHARPPATPTPKERRRPKRKADRDRVE